MIRRLLAGVAVAAFATSVQAQTTSEARVLEILKTTPLIDGHNDLPWALRQQYGNDVYAVDLTTNLEATTRLHTDIARLRAAPPTVAATGPLAGLESYEQICARLA